VAPLNENVKLVAIDGQKIDRENKPRGETGNEFGIGEFGEVS